MFEKTERETFYVVMVKNYFRDDTAVKKAAVEL